MRTAKTATYGCKKCGKEFSARVADRNRGWALFCSKRCKAVHQERRTGQYKQYMEMVGAAGRLPSPAEGEIQ